MDELVDDGTEVVTADSSSSSDSVPSRGSYSSDDDSGFSVDAADSTEDDCEGRGGINPATA